ncbi:endonuclease domain-containing protein [Sphingomonas bacterium]|uniref:endonuclease domain-containing protein n=1 Tax=Sphingomonas bacterium TaxID=1895847 RepID=UPI0020C6E055|nr:endonuclease domain-containing protein [Sphingomonas bacterium]
MISYLDPPLQGEGDHAQHGGGGSPPLRRPEVVTARALRKKMSLPEVMLWERLRGGRAGAKARRQHPIGPYVVDFCFGSSRLIVEIDGEAHNRANRPARDILRDQFLNENGYRVARFAAADVLRDADAVAASIASIVAGPLHQPAAGPPPRAGEDQE